MRILHVGCGRKQLRAADLCRSVGLLYPDADLGEVVHLDADATLRPDVVATLGVDPLPLEDASIDLVIAWHVLEHIGRQGETAAWFFAFEELYRVLRPDGLLYGEVPYWDSVWAWSDPTHTRALSEDAFVFFNQDSYRVPESAISPYRVACDFQFAALGQMARGWMVTQHPTRPQDRSLRFALAARKPLRPWWLHAADPAPGKDA